MMQSFTLILPDEYKRQLCFSLNMWFSSSVKKPGVVLVIWFLYEKFVGEDRGGTYQVKTEILDDAKCLAIQGNYQENDRD
jgi:hypothetical protein